MPNIDVIIPLYNGKQYIDSILTEFASQEGIVKKSLHFVLTDTGDGSKEILDERGCDYTLIKPEDFSHSLTREEAIMNSDADIVIMLTQDCRLVNNDVYEKLVSAINDEVKFAYLRQVNTNKSIERYTRAINYPAQSEIKDQTTIETRGLNAFFASDACAAYDVAYFKSVDGYDHKNLPTNEDMYYARKVILNGKKVAYVAETFVDHTHNFKCKEIKERYRLVGLFFKQNPEFQQYHAGASGMGLAKKVLGQTLKHFDIKNLFLFVPNMWARYSGKKAGEK